MSVPVPVPAPEAVGPVTPGWVSAASATSGEVVSDGADRFVSRSPSAADGAVGTTPTPPRTAKTVMKSASAASTIRP
ncbi:hypothetical protein [Nocardioides sp.]|uniref:hypothetical protein n=1 Tax=Nocardioides sp. TaxID=35761 RepID=UPI002C2D6ABC|nr:hypothetical protein [Nocardioides sp.]HXH80482.1 hypothetical protein [Nocardioides sp.]